MADTKVKKKKKKEKEATPKVDVQRFKPIVKRRRQMPRGAHGGMKLLLTENVPHLGEQGSVVEVKPGYGRNYLIPHGLAAYVTPETMLRIEKHKAKVEALRIAKIQDLKRLGKSLEALSISIEANANEEGHLYGSVTAVDIIRALEKEKFGLAEDQIRLEGPIKELGLYHVAVHLGEDVNTEVKVWVVPASGKAGPAK